MVSSEPVQSPVEISAHVCVVGVTFVDDDHLAGQSEMAQHDVLLLQGRHKELVHRAYDEVG